MKITIEIRTDSAAWGDDFDKESEHIGRQIALKMPRMDEGEQKTLLDSNGNTTGSITITETEG